jgi:hypothetical protein
LLLPLTFGLVAGSVGSLAGLSTAQTTTPCAQAPSVPEWSANVTISLSASGSKTDSVGNQYTINASRTGNLIATLGGPGFPEGTYPDEVVW